MIETVKNECILEVMFHFLVTNSKLKYGLNFWETIYIVKCAAEIYGLWRERGRKGGWEGEIRNEKWIRSFECVCKSFKDQLTNL